jgi:hypothetical protein
MKNIEHKFLSTTIYAPIHMTLGDPLLSMRKKMSADAVVREFQLILLEKETGKKFWRIIIKQELT